MESLQTPVALLVRFCNIALLGFILCSVNLSTVYAQELEDNEQLQAKSFYDYFNDGYRGTNSLRISFWNVENLFDTDDDPNKRDDEFLPTGMKGWGYNRYNNKLISLYKVIVSIGGWEPVEVLGLCEVENKRVLLDLLEKTPLQQMGYEILHQDSPDRRGIDVAMLYRPDKFKIESYDFINVRFPFDTTSLTRDILYVKGSAAAMPTEPVHLFFNHWPSKFGGEVETEPKRMFVAQKVRALADSIYAINPDARIIISGDFNDEPETQSMLKGLKAEAPKPDSEPNALINLMQLPKPYWLGTHKYQEKWSIIDQFVVSPAILNDEQVKISNMGANIFMPEWLLVQEDLRLGKKVNRTYLGMRYLGGYSDHLPIYLDLIFPN